MRITQTKLLRCYAPDGGGGGGAPAAQPPAVAPLPIAPPGTPPAAAAAFDAAAAAAAAAPPPAAEDGRKVISMRSDAIGKLKAEQRDRGARETRDELEKQARDAGFASLDEALKAISDARARPPAPPVPAAAAPEPPEPTPGSPQQPGESKNAYRFRQQAERERDDARRKLGRETEARRALQAQLEAKDAEMELRTTAVQSGIQDVDYAMVLLQRHLASLPDAELETFDETKFFADLRAKKPYLFGETVVPANNGTGVSGAATSPARVAAAAAQAGAFDARKLPAGEVGRQSFMQRLAALGVKPTRV